MRRNGILSDTDITDARDQEDDIIIIPFNYNNLKSYGYDIYLCNTYFKLKNNNNDKNYIDPWNDNFLKDTWDINNIINIINDDDKDNGDIYLNPGDKILSFSNEFIYVEDHLYPEIKNIDRLSFANISVLCKNPNHLARWPLIITNNNNNIVKININKPIATIIFHVLISDSFYPKDKLYSNINPPSEKKLIDEWNPKQFFIDFYENNDDIQWDSDNSTSTTYKNSLFKHSNQENDIIYHSQQNNNCNTHSCNNRSCRRQHQKNIEKGKEPINNKQPVHNNEIKKLTKNQRKSLAKRNKRKLKKQQQNQQNQQNDNIDDNGNSDIQDNIIDDKFSSYSN
jgi:hypothetical protein